MSPEPNTITSDSEGKAAFVTGADSGIGRATALAFARAGANVVVADIAAELVAARDVEAITRLTAEAVRIAQQRR